MTLPRKADFIAFEKVRAGGRWNMWSREAENATGLIRVRYLAILSNYNALMERYPGIRKETE